jgi:hypothetical protein
MSPRGVTTRPLPASGELKIGRAPDSDVLVDDAHASRLHAILRVGERCEIVDQGSRNGLLVRDRRLAPREAMTLSGGEMITIGSTVLVLQAATRLFDAAAFDKRSSSTRWGRCRSPCRPSSCACSSNVRSGASARSSRDRSTRASSRRPFSMTPTCSRTGSEYALRAGENIDLVGATSNLDFDPATGEVPVDQAFLCVALDDHGRPYDTVESGLVYDSGKHRLAGSLHCP